jgi:hypothetical protein
MMKGAIWVLHFSRIIMTVISAVRVKVVEVELLYAWTLFERNRSKRWLIVPLVC